MKLNPTHSRNQNHFQARLETLRNALKRNTEEVGPFPSPKAGSSLFKSDLPSYSSVDEIVMAGNQDFEELDNVDFAKFRNDKELGRQTLADAQEDLLAFHADRSSQAYKNDLSRILHARYLQGHGVQVQTHLDQKELRTLRKYLQKESSTNNVADAVRAINSSLSQGVEQVDTLTLEAERRLFQERGLGPDIFERKFAKRDLKDLERVRDFSDAWSNSQGGKFLNTVRGNSFAENRDVMAREMLASHGYQGLESLSLDTVLSLLRDIDAEGPRSNASIKKAVNELVAQGQSDYFVLNTEANKAILRELGLSDSVLNKFKVKDKDLKAQYPDKEPAESRAIRTRVLRDLLRVLPQDERQMALDELLESGSDLLSAEASLKKHLGKRVRSFVGQSTSYKDMGAMQRANFTAALSKLPEEVRETAFQGTEKQAKNTLEKLIESQFGIEVHRTPGKAPEGGETNAPYVKDWPVQGLVDLYNAMSAMSKDGILPQTLIGNSTICYVEGSGKTPSMDVGPQPIEQDPVGPWDRPGSQAHDSGKSGYYGMCFADDTGHDMVYFCDDALKGTNADSADSATIGESTIIHEFAHAIQLGGTPGAELQVRQREQQELMAEWSSLSDWRESDQLLADGRLGSFEYYYDPSVQVGQRREVATSYGASDPCEDFAEFTPYFYKAPDVALELSVEKFLYLNQMVGDFYTDSQIRDVAGKVGVGPSDLAKAENHMRKKVAHSAAAAGIAS